MSRTENSSHGSYDAVVDPALVSGRVSKPLSFDAAVAKAARGSEDEQAAVLESLAHAATLPMAEDHPTGCALCQRCEVLPAPLAGPGVLHLNLPHTHTLGKVLQALGRSGLSYTRDDGTVRIEAGPEGPGRALGLIDDLLTSTERRDARAIFQPGGGDLAPSDYFRVASLTTVLAKESATWLLDLLRADRLTSHFQPILRADGSAVHAYECLMRGDHEGRLVAPARIFDSARRADLLFQVDMAGRKAAITAAAAHRLTAQKVFINFSPNAIYDPSFCLDSTVRLVDDGGLDRGQVVFEVTEAERLPDLGHLRQIADYYRERGFGLALDDVGAGYASLQVLLGVRPDYVKLDMSLVRGVDADRDKAVLALKLIEACRELGLATVAEGVETAEEWAWVRDHGVDYVQGYLFGKATPEPRTPEMAAVG